MIMDIMDINLENKKKKNWLIILPILVILFWGIFCLIHENFYLTKYETDFTYFYDAGHRIANNPLTLYDVSQYYHLPIFAYSFIFISMFPYWNAMLVMFAINIIVGILFVIELNKVFQLMNIKNNLTRAVYISIICSSWNIYLQFYYCQVKIIVVLILIFVIRREIQYKEQKKSFNSKKKFWYYFINYFLIAYSLSITPYMIFFYLILFMDDFGKGNLFKRESLMKMGGFVGIIVAQNFIFIIHPILFIEYISGVSFFHLYYLVDILPYLSFNIFQILSIPFLIILISLNLLILFSNYDLKTKMGLSGVVYLLFNGYGTSGHFIYIMLMFFLLIAQVKERESFIKTIKEKENRLVILGMLFILILNVSSVYNSAIRDEFSILFNPPFEIFMISRHIILIGIITFILIIMGIKVKRKKKKVVSLCPNCWELTSSKDVVELCKGKVIEKYKTKCSGYLPIKEKYECIDCNNPKGDYNGHFKIKLSRAFKKEYGRKGMDRKPYCLNCIYDMLSGSHMSFYPDYIKSFKRIDHKKVEIVDNE
jgi:hypothetical protein